MIYNVPHVVNCLMNMSLMHIIISLKLFNTYTYTRVDIYMIIIELHLL